MYLARLIVDLGFKSNVIGGAYPELTWKIIDKVPDVLGIGGITLFGIMWVINRRIEMKRRMV